SSAGTTATAAGDAGKAAAADASAKSSGMASQLPMLIAGGGVALAGLSAAFGLLLSTFMDAAGALAAALSGLPVFTQLGGGAQTAIQLASLPLAVVLLLTAVVLVPFLIYAIPVAIATWLRLRRRDLSALLEGAGWAVNTRQYISRDLARTITRTPLVSPANVRRG
ncbi:MAG: hypothetical protein KC656_29330, partial [Myxococcales bacterium]|nr:hypothetical protein [Myxococcales bacterium]